MTDSDQARRTAEAIAARSWTYATASPDETRADSLVRLACLNYADDHPGRIAEAANLLAEHPELPSADIAVAATCADVRSLQRLLDSDRGAAVAPSGPFGWSPLMYLAYSRMEAPRADVLGAAELLLQHAADPNDGRFFGGLPTPFTVLTGVLGGGEREQPAHPHAIPLARLLLSHGAEPNDGQALYNRMFGEADDFLQLLFEFGLGRGDGGPWRRLLPDLLNSPTELLRDLLAWAVLHDQRARVVLLARNGVDVVRPLPSGTTPLAVAVGNGHLELAAELRGLGAVEPTLDPVGAFIAAALAGQSDAVQATPHDVVEAARLARPALIVWAAGLQRVDAIGILITAGFDVNALGRGDVPVEQQWQTALHTAVERGNAELVRFLLAAGADQQVRDARFDGTARDWADHLGRPELVELLDS